MPNLAILVFSAVGAGIATLVIPLAAESPPSGGAVGNMIQGGAGAAIAYAIAAIINRAIDARVDKKRFKLEIDRLTDLHASEMKRFEIAHMAEIQQIKQTNTYAIQDLQRQIDAGKEERQRIADFSAIRQDELLVKIQCLQLGEAWNKIQLEAATGKTVEPRPPLYTEDAESALRRAGIAGPGSSRGDVLVIDDDVDTVKAYKKLLRHHGWTVRSAPNVPLALQLLRERRPDVIISDLVLPDGSGADLVRNVLTEDHPRPRLIVITGYPNDERVDEIRGLGVMVVEKPIAFQRLLDIMTPMDDVADPSDYNPPIHPTGG